MTEYFEIWKTNRQHYLNTIEELTNEQLNTVPKGFNNNIIWNIGHAIAIQQVLIYKRSDLDMYINDDFYSLYKSGSKPERIIEEAEVEQINALLTSTIDSTIQDLKTGKDKFKSYNSLTTSTQFHLGTLSKAIQFNNYHEGLHLGAIFSLKKLV